MTVLIKFSTGMGWKEWWLF